MCFKSVTGFMYTEESFLEQNILKGACHDEGKGVRRGFFTGLIGSSHWIIIVTIQPFVEISKNIASDHYHPYHFSSLLS